MKKHKKIVIIIVGVLLLGIASLISLELSDTTHLFRDSPDTRQEADSTAKTTSKAPSAQSDFTGSDSEKEPGNTLNENRGSALIEESSSANIKNDNPMASSTGEIIAHSPAKNSVVTNGTILSGTSSLPRVEYRITDTVSGVIATGSLTVKDGKFSGKISFDTGAPEGRIDLFATRSDFTEYSYVEIPIKFKN